MKDYETKELKELMDYVGKTLMNKMDCSYETWLNIFQTESKLKRTNQIKSRELYQKLSEEDRKMLLTIIRRVCFNVIYSLLRESQESQAGFPDALYFAARCGVPRKLDSYIFDEKVTKDRRIGKISSKE